MSQLEITEDFIYSCYLFVFFNICSLLSYIVLWLVFNAFLFLYSFRCSATRIRWRPRVRSGQVLYPRRVSCKIIRFSLCRELAFAFYVFQFDVLQKIAQSEARIRLKVFHVHFMLYSRALYKTFLLQLTIMPFLILLANKISIRIDSIFSMLEK